MRNVSFRCVSIITAATVATLGSLSVQANDEQTVQVASLQVKERLRSIEQINVSAETTPTEEKPISDAVAKLLEEAETLDAE